MKKITLLLLSFFLMTYVFTQNVGIGTATPAFKLDVQGRMRVKTGTLNNVNTSSGIWFEDYRNANNQLFFGMKDSIRGGFYGSGAGIGWDMVFNTKTGIFSDKFSLNGAINIHSGITDHFGGALYTDSNDIYLESRKGATLGSRGNLILQYSNSQSMNIPGNVGIGTNDPAQKLDVSGNIKVSGELQRPATGLANLLPICYGSVNIDGVILSGSGNFTITMFENGYNLDVDNMDLTTSNSIIIITPAGQYPRLSSASNGYTFPGGTNPISQFWIKFKEAHEDLTLMRTPFSFVIFKP